MDKHLELHALLHPNPEVRRFGFDLTDPYLEHCWSALLGPSCVAILRRTPVLWSEQNPARVESLELARAIGLRSASGRRFSGALDRVTSSGFGCWIEDGRSLGIYTQVRPIQSRQLERLPEWTKATHERLLAEHLDRIAAGHDQPNQPNQLNQLNPITHITTRLNHLQQPPNIPANNSRSITQ